jgi:hypothetical protein
LLLPADTAGIFLRDYRSTLDYLRRAGDICEVEIKLKILIVPIKE